MINIKFYLRIAVLASLTLATVSTNSLWAGEIHQWRDKDGNLHFGDAPPQNVSSQQVAIRTNTYSTSAPASRSEAAAATAGDSETEADSAAAPKVVLYSTTWCGYCKKAKSYFQSNNIAFTEYDVEKSRRGKADFKKFGGGGVPIILVGNTRLRGFSPAKFARAYASR